VTDDPPTLIVCVNLASRQNEIIRANRVLCVNTLALGQTDIATLFSTKELPIEQRFTAGAWSTLATGSPVLEGALAAFDCRVVERLERGTHSVIFCEVQAVRIRPEGEPLIYFGRHYLGLGAPHSESGQNSDS
jgi:flavin reductase